MFRLYVPVSRAIPIFLLLLTGFTLSAEDDPVPAAAESPPAATESGTEPLDAKPDDLFAKTLYLDISTASFYELVAWCRREGLSDSGQIEELRNRLYGKLKVVKPEPAAPKVPEKQEDGAEGHNEVASGQSEIIIESAKTTEYFTVPGSEEKYARLSGGVKIRMKEKAGGKEHFISADEVIHNKTRNVLTANGNVAYNMKGSGSEDWFFGNTVTVDLDTWETDFLDARNERSSPGSTDAVKFIFEADSIYRTEDNVMVLENAVITSCEDEFPHYSIKAPRMWLLGGSEWAISNAVLYVGHIPVFWFPFFYLPGDEMFFNPVLGNRQREGQFLQTTTYLLGKKVVKDGGFSLMKLAKTSGNDKKEWKGLFLRSTGKTDPKTSRDYVKVMVDYYSNLGGFAGIQGSMQPGTHVPKFDFFVGLGLSRNVYSVSSSLYSPFSENHGFESMWNPVYVAGISFPFRFGINVSTNFKVAGLTIGLEIPLYSDPFFNIDFLDRSETLDWFSLLQKGKAITTTQAEISGLSLRASSSWIPDFKLPSPWLDAVSVSKANTSLSFVTRTAIKEDASFYETVDPARKFFVPDQYVVADLGLDLRGTLFHYPLAIPAVDQSFIEKKDSGGLDSPYRAPAVATPDADEGSADGTPRTKPDEIFRGVSILTSYPGMTARVPLVFDLSWKLSPSGSYEKRYNTLAWKKSSDIDFSELYSLGILRLSGDTTAKLMGFDNLLVLTLSASGYVSWQEHGNILDDPLYVSDAVRLGYLTSDYSGRTERILGNLNLTSNPFQDIKLFSTTSLNYTFNIVGYEKKLFEMNGTNPVYSENWFDWSKDRISTHAAGVVFGIAPFGWNESLSLTATLPPKDESYRGILSLRLFDFTVSADTTWAKDATTSEFKFTPLSVISAFKPLKPFEWFSVQDTLHWDIGNERPIDNKTTLVVGPMNAWLNFLRTKAYYLQVGTGWIPTGEEGFRMTDFGFSFSTTINPEPFFMNRVTLSIKPTSNLTFNTLKFTESMLSFTLNLTAKLNKVFDVTFSSSSTNGAVYKYFIGLPGIDTGIVNDVWVNPIEDILKGFDFFNTNNRYKSLFKINSLSVALNIDLHDWILTFGYTGKPELNSTTTPQKYEFNSYFTIMLKWKAVPEIKSDVRIDPKGFYIQ